MPAVTTEQLENAAIDCATIGSVANAPATINGTGLVATRTGGWVKVLSKLSEEFQEIIDAQVIKEETATSSAAIATAAVVQAQQAANRAIALLFQRFGLPGLTVDFTTNTSINVGEEIDDGLAMDFLTFSRASVTTEISGSAFTVYASGAAALTAEGLSIRPAREQLNEYAQDLSQAAFWTVTNTAVASAGAGPLGTDAWILANTATTGTHSIRQSEAAVDLTPHTQVAVWKPRGTATMSFGLGSAFGTGVIANFTTSGGTTSKAEITSLGTIPLADGWYMSWAVATPVNTTTSAQYIYNKNSSSYASAGESIDVASVEFYKGDSPVLPIMTPGTTTVSRAADVVYYTTSGAAHTFGARFITNAARSPTGYRLLLGTATNHIAVLQSAGKLVLRAVVSGVTVVNVIGPNVSNDDEIGIRYSESTKAIEWAVNGIMQTGANAGPTGPTGLTRVYLGSDASGANQVNGKVAWFEVGRGLSAKLISGTGGADEETGAGAFDTTQIVVIPSATEILIGHHLPGGANDDWLWRSLDKREQVAYRSVGWARGRIFHAKRTGIHSYGTIIKTILNVNTANDDSWKINNAEPNEFNAIMNAPSQHGFVEATDVHFYVDGVEFDPAVSGPLIGGRFKGIQNCNALNPLTCLRGVSAVQFDTTGKFANFDMEWVINAKDQLLFTPTKTFTTDATCTNACYLNMTQLANDDTIWTKAIAREGAAAIFGGGSVDFTTTGTWVHQMGNTYECRADWLSGFTGTAKIFVKNTSGSSAIHKIYNQYRTDSVYTLTAGTVITATFQEQFNLR